MKLLSKQIFTFVLFITAFQLSRSQVQAPFKNTTTISPVLKLGFPDTFSTSKNRYMNTYSGVDSTNLYEVIYFNNVEVNINSEPDFNLSLKSLVAGKFSGKAFKSYDLRLTDTLIGNLAGFFIKGITDDTLQDVKKFYCFVTIANSNSYWFFNNLKKQSLPTEKADSFFSSIQFDRGKIKEASFKINRFKKHKLVGEIWYLSPELNYPMPPKEIIKENQVAPSYPPRPPDPPINRKWLVKANKLASDYLLNRSLAEKKYKKGSFIIVEGIVKEIKEPDEHGIVTIILDGGSSKIDVQCEVLNSFKIRNLKKGMKATLDAHCNGFNGNVILSGCIYIEKPTYE